MSAIADPADLESFPRETAKPIDVISRGWQLALFSLLTLVFATFNIFASPLHGGSPNGAIAHLWGGLRLGILFGQPAVLGFWSVFGPQRFAIRATGAFFLATLFAYCLLFSEVWWTGYVNLHGLLQTPIMAFVLLVSAQAPFAILRRMRSWRLLWLGDMNAQRGSDRRFGLVLLFAWMSLAAVVFALWRVLPVNDQFGIGAMGWQWLISPLLFAVMSLPAIPLAGLVLSTGRRIGFGIALVAMFLACPLLVAAVVVVVEGGPGSDLTNLGPILSGMEMGVLCASLLPFALARLAGWRLIRPRSTGPAPRSLAIAPQHSIPRVAIAFSLVFALGAIEALLAIDAEENRQEQRQRAEWSQKGMSARFRGHQLVSMVSSAPELADEVVSEIARIDTLRELTLSSGSKVTADQLARLLSNRSIESLDLFGCALPAGFAAAIQGATQLKSLLLAHSSVTDADLAALAPLQSLETIILTGAGVTDAGVAHLEQLPNLKLINLEQTTVSQGAIDRLRARFPKANIFWTVPGTNTQTYPATP